MAAILLVLRAVGLFFARFGGWLVALFPAIKNWFPALGAWGAKLFVENSVAVAIQVAVMTAWGVLLALFFTGLTGMSLVQFFTTNPFAGFPEAMMYLVAGAFPIHFAVGLVTAYITWKFTVAKAALICVRTCRWLTGN